MIIMAIRIAHISIVHVAQGGGIVITPAHSIEPSQLPWEFTAPTARYVLRG